MLDFSNSILRPVLLPPVCPSYPVTAVVDLITCSSRHDYHCLLLFNYIQYFRNIALFGCNYSLFYSGDVSRQNIVVYHSAGCRMIPGLANWEHHFTFLIWLSTVFSSVMRVCPRRLERHQSTSICQSAPLRITLSQSQLEQSPVLPPPSQSLQNSL